MRTPENKSSEEKSPDSKPESDFNKHNPNERDLSLSNQSNFIVPGADESIHHTIESILTLPQGSSASVVGAPGSGKTCIMLDLLERYSEIFEPEEVLVIAPHRLLANRLNSKALSALLKKKKVRAGRLVVTPASFAFNLVRRAQGRPKLLSGADEDRIISEILFCQSGVTDKSDARFEFQDELFHTTYAMSPNFRSQMRFFIEYISRHKIDIKSFRELDRWRDCAVLIEKYRAAREDSETFTPFEIIECATNLIPEINLPHRIVMVDEAQELADEHIRLLSSLAESGATVIMFGTPDKAVTQTACPAAFVDFATHTFVLKKVFRSANQLHSLSQKMCQGIGVATSVVDHRRSVAVSNIAGDIRTLVSPSYTSSITDIARWLREKHLLGGIAWSDMAVIVFHRASAEIYLHFLERSGVPVQILGGGVNLIEKPVAGAILNAIEFACFPDCITGKALIKLLMSPIGGFDPLLFRRLALELKEIAPKQIQVSHERVLWAFHTYCAEVDTQVKQDETYRSFLATKPGKALEKIFYCLVTLRRLYEEQHASLSTLIWHVYSSLNLKSVFLKRTGQNPEIAQRVFDEVIALQKLADMAEGKDPLCSAGDILRAITGAEVPVDNLSIKEKPNCVTILTPASSVGYSYRAVVISDMQDSHKMDSTHFDPELALSEINKTSFSSYFESKLATHRHNLLRSLYQAVTRATSDLLVSVIDNSETSPSWLFYTFFSGYPPCEFSRLPLTPRGLVTQLRLDLERDPKNEEAARALQLLAKGGVTQANPKNWYGYLPLTKNTFNTIKSISPSSLDKFKVCPLHWFINQIGCDSRFSTAADVGTIVHKSMQEATHNNGQPNLRDFVEDAYKKLGEVDFESRWMLEREKKRLAGLLRKLVDYLTDFAVNGGKLLAAEKSFKLNLDILPGRSITLIGQIDRLERLSTGEIRIVDLKTGNNLPSKKETEDNLQLSAYQLAFENVDGVSPSAMLLYPAVGKQRAAMRLKGPMQDAAKRILENSIREILVQNDSCVLTAALQEHCESNVACKKLMVPHVSFTPNFAVSGAGNCPTGFAFSFSAQ